ncbi:hypothetical protein EJ08DRAFT_736438 [Tothia fuscella]|uniref:Uncharacterized protein n=1 Tax=Tothia fuscella TaxID=1048955 RepID=A0A9P4NLS5_9PEZI|nr:hypothetical protein EJ08DRAFT_736438 [Tothia fuscella]
MASPLAPLSDRHLNARSPSPMPLFESKSPAAQTNQATHVHSNVDESEMQWDEGPSSPFLSQVVDDTQIDNENAMLSAIKPFALSEVAPSEADEKENREEFDNTPLKSKSQTPFTIVEDDTCTYQSVKSTAFTSHSVVASPTKSLTRTSSSRSVHEETTVTSQFKQEYQSQTQLRTAFDDSELIEPVSGVLNDDDNIDDTCFSTFSQVPNTDMTAFARLGQSPTKRFDFDQPTPRPRSSHQQTPGTTRNRFAQRSSRSPSPTPKRIVSIPYHDSSDTTNLLLDFTQQFESVAITKEQQRMQARSPTRRSPIKSQAEPHLLSYLHNQRSPGRSAYNSNFSTPTNSKKTILNLLDFELPPAPTPRSVPSITIRELESLKSKYSSEISSLRATLSGREAEVEALKRAVSDAERRVGEAVESNREERSKREYVEKEKEEWERRGREFEDVLRKVKEEVMEAEKERNDMMTRIDEADERARDAETRASEAEARALEAATKVVSTGITSADGHDGPLFTAEQVQKQIDDKVHSLSTELHAIYKKKHVTKVAGLKKGFEAKTKEKTAELQIRVEELEQRNEELQAKIDATLSGILPADLRLAGGDPTQREEELRQIEEQNILIERQKAELAGRDQEIRTAREEYASLMSDLERERVEKGELVAAVDEMLSLQQNITEVAGPAAGNAVEDFKKNVGICGPPRPPSGLRGPGFGAPTSRIGAPAGLNRSISGGKSRMMSNIERMGSGRSVE